jgi:anti-anti-sigma factor
VADFQDQFRDDGVAVLRVSGDVDLAVLGEFKRAMRASLARSEAMELDLQGVTFMDSSGLGSLVLVRNEAEQQSKSLTLVNVSSTVNRLLHVTGLADAFDVRPPLS